MESLFAPIGPAPSYKRAAEAIELQIVSRRLRPGDLLPTEIDLAAQLGINRSTLREAIRLLENMGLVRRGGAKRLVVSLPTSGDISRAVTRALGLGNSTFLDLWEVQINLEPFAASLAAQRAPAALIEALRENLREMERCIEDDETIIRLDVEFHNLVARATLNLPLQLAMEPIGVLLLSATQTLYERSPHARTRLVQAHRHIQTAIAAGDQAAAMLWMGRHIRDFRNGLKIAGLRMETPVPIAAS